MANNPQNLRGPWQKGQSGNPAGRPKRLFPRVDEWLKTHGIDPLAELMKLCSELDSRDQAKLWLELMSYIHAKPKEEPVSERELERIKLEQMSDAELVTLVKEKLPALESA